MTAQIRLIISAIALAMVIISGYFLYSHIRNLGYQEASLECTAKFDKYQKELDTKIAEMQSSISSLSTNLSSQNDSLTQDISVILARTKNKPTVVVKEGKCVIADTFIKDVNEAIERVNKK